MIEIDGSRRKKKTLSAEKENHPLRGIGTDPTLKRSRKLHFIKRPGNAGRDLSMRKSPTLDGPMVSEKLRVAVWRRRIHGEKQYEIAHRANLHPSVLSALLNAIIPIRPNDERVKAIGAAVGVPPDECFEISARG